MATIIITAFHYRGYSQQLDIRSLQADVQRISKRYSQSRQYLLTDIPQLSKQLINSPQDYLISLTRIVQECSQQPVIFYFTGHGIRRGTHYYLAVPWFQYPRIRYVDGGQIGQILNLVVPELFLILDCCYATGIAIDIVKKMDRPTRAIASCREQQRCGFLRGEPYGSLFTYFWSNLVGQYRQYHKIKEQLDQQINAEAHQIGRLPQNIALVRNRLADDSLPGYV